MKTLTHKMYFMAAALAAALGWGGFAAAGPLTNGDFSAGFTGWQGTVIDLGYTATPISPLPGSYTNNYAISGGGALLTTTATAAAPNDIWSVDLVQLFDIQTLNAPGNTLQLSLNVVSTLSDSFADAAFAQLEDLSAAPLASLSLLGGGLFDITAWAGRSVKLTFSVQDGDDTADTLSVKNIGITETQAPVPEPASLLLLAAGLMAMRRKVF